MKETKCDSCGVNINRDKRIKVKGLTGRSGILLPNRLHVKHFCDTGCLVRWMEQNDIIAKASQATLGGFLLEDGTSGPRAPKSRATRLPDALFDVLAGFDGGKELTRCAQRAVAVALAEIKRATPSVTPMLIVERANNLALHFPTCTVTASSLAKHWARCASPPLQTRNGQHDHNHNIDKEMGTAWELQAQARLQSLSASQANP